MEFSRRRLLMGTLFGSGLLGLRSLATGIPMAILANPRQALAVPPPVPSRPHAAQYIILSTSADGDPLSCNAPGTYLNPDLVHPSAPAMAPTALRLSGQSVTAARPWSTLPQNLLDRTCFFHHGTYSVVHSEEQRVLALGGDGPTDEMFVSMLAARLAPTLGTVQPEPIVLGPRNASEALVYQTRPQPIVAPSALALLLGAPTGALGQLTQLRDRDLNRMNAWIRCEGTAAQAAFIDQYVRSQAQVRVISEDLLSTLQQIHDDYANAQILAAVTLLRMNVAPVISLHIPFGGDNHGDSNLARETSQTLTGVASLGRLWSTLQQHGMQDRVSFLSLNVFGRTMSRARATNGRAHNANHHVAVMFGPAFRGSVVGGIEPREGDFGATSINATTGQGVPGEAGEVRFRGTFKSMAATFGQGVGVPPSDLPALSGSTVINAGLAS